MSNVKALVAGHGAFAEGLLSAVEQITGRSEVFIPVTNRDLSAAGVEELIRAKLASSGARVIFTDLPAGSCTMAARRIQREDPGVSVVTGVNLATLLDFAFHEDANDAGAVAHAADKGRAALSVLGGERARGA
jgi:PTS system N-acetylgalactosamine-specific IIA component